MLEYKVVESSTVTDEELQRIINEQVQAGWQFDGIQFAMRESSKRPAMAFLIFTSLPARGEGDESGNGRVLSLRRPRKKEKGP
jgi:hypothetical protein